MQKLKLNVESQRGEIVYSMPKRKRFSLFINKHMQKNLENEKDRRAARAYNRF